MLSSKWDRLIIGIGSSSLEKLSTVPSDSIFGMKTFLSLGCVVSVPVCRRLNDYSSSFIFIGDNCYVRAPLRDLFGRSGDNFGVNAKGDF